MQQLMSSITGGVPDPVTTARVVASSAIAGNIVTATISIVTITADIFAFMCLLSSYCRLLFVCMPLKHRGFIGISSVSTVGWNMPTAHIEKHISINSAYIYALRVLQRFYTFHKHRRCLSHYGAIYIAST